ncbi:MAG: hypothetical protein IK125_06515 [Lachnospiraceae bacterium]|nr:hypothetical protein [Lachnospiraceae bacterium]
MKRVHVMVYGLLCLLVMLAGVLAYLIVRFFDEKAAVTTLCVFCVLAFPAAYVLKKLLLKNEKNSSAGARYLEFRNEFLTNDYTDKAYAIAEQVIRDHSYGFKVSIAYLKDYVLFTADYFNQLEEYETAYRYLTVLEPKEIRSKSLQLLDKGASWLFYLGVRLTSLARMGRGNEARETWEEVHKRFGSRTDDMFRLMLDSIDFEYYLMLKDHEQMQKIAEQSLTYTSDYAKQNAAPYLINAELCIYDGKKEEAAAFMERVWEIVHNSSAPLVQSYHLQMKRFGLEEPTHEIL